MVHIANCGPNAPGPMFFNVDWPVGAGGPVGMMNEDTQLVQWMLRKLGYYGGINDEGYSGVNDDETVAAITQFQNDWGPQPADGTVSVAHGVSFGASQALYTIVRLNYYICDKFRGHGWPNINQIQPGPMAPLAWNRVAKLLGNSGEFG